MWNRLQEIIGFSKLLKRLKTTLARQSAIVVLVMVPLVSAVVICTALIVPILWTTVTENAALQPKLTYQQCGVVKEETTRLACYDDVFRQTSLRPIKDMR